MSVGLGDTLDALGRGPQTLLAHYPNEFLVSLPARTARDQTQVLVRDPVPEEQAHGLVVGKKTLSRRKAFLRDAAWIAAPPDSCAEPGG